MHTSIVARLAGIAGGLAVAAFVGPPLLVRLGWLSPMAAFGTFMLGALLGAIALVLGVMGLWATRQAAGRSGRSAALFASLAGLAITAVVASQAGPSADYPPINDITTDLVDPPAFRALAEEPANAGRDMAHPGDEFAAAQREAYPDLAPLELPLSPAAAFEHAEAAAESVGWQVVRADRDRGELEATETTRLFRFVDDVAVRVRPGPSGSRVDVRSKSRDGRGDLGANALRIRRFREALDQSTEARSRAQR